MGKNVFILEFNQRPRLQLTSKYWSFLTKAQNMRKRSKMEWNLKVFFELYGIYKEMLKSCKDSWQPFPWQLSCNHRLLGNGVRHISVSTTAAFQTVCQTQMTLNCVCQTFRVTALTSHLQQSVTVWGQTTASAALKTIKALLKEGKTQTIIKEMMCFWIEDDKNRLTSR